MSGARRGIKWISINFLLNETFELSQCIIKHGRGLPAEANLAVFRCSMSKVLGWACCVSLP